MPSPRPFSDTKYSEFSINMQLAIILAALIAVGTGDSPIEARQFSGTGTMSLYSQPGCQASNLLAKDVTISTRCTTLDTPVASVMFHGGTGNLPFERELQSYPPHTGEHTGLTYLQKQSTLTVTPVAVVEVSMGIRMKVYAL